MTPLANPRTPQEVRYNLKHARAHSVIGLLVGCAWMQLVECCSTGQRKNILGTLLLPKKPSLFTPTQLAQHCNGTGCTGSLWTTHTARTCGWRGARASPSSASSTPSVDTTFIIAHNLIQFFKIAFVVCCSVHSIIEQMEFVKVLLTIAKKF